jgi:hypothetical protein
MNYDINLSDYKTKEKIEKELLSSLSFFRYLFFSIFVLFYLFSIYKDFATLFVFITLSVLAVFIDLYLVNSIFPSLYKEHVKDAWTIENVKCDNRKYIMLTKNDEARFFENNILSNHVTTAIKSLQAIREPYLTDPNVVFPYFYQGKLIKAKNDKEFANFIKISSKISTFD